MKFNEFINESHNVDFIKKLDITRDYHTMKTFDAVRVADDWLPVEGADKEDVLNAQKWASISDMVHEAFTDAIYGANALYTAQKKLESIMPVLKEVPNDADYKVKGVIKKLEKIFKMLESDAFRDLEEACGDLNLSTLGR